MYAQLVAGDETDLIESVEQCDEFDWIDIALVVDEKDFESIERLIEEYDMLKGVRSTVDSSQVGIFEREMVRIM